MTRICTAFCVLIMTGAPAWAQNPTQCALQAGLSVIRPIAATHAAPPYPLMSQRTGEEGTTVLKVAIGADGVPSDVTVTKSSGAVRLDEAAATFVKAVWRWEPPLAPDCKAISATTPVNVVWNATRSQNLDALRYTEVDLPLADYPVGAADRKEQGFVTLTVTVIPNGTAKTAVQVSSGYPDLDSKALDIINTRYRWKPGEINGKPAVTLLGILAVWTLPVPPRK